MKGTAMKARHVILVGGMLTVATGAMVMAQQRAPSPDGLASTEVGGRYEGARTPYYVGGKWIEVSYGRPIKRGRELWGSGSTYGVWLNRQAPVWRAGADVSTYLMTQATLVLGGERVAPGGYSMFIDLAPDDWTLIVSNWQPQRSFDPTNTEELWGSYGYTPDKDVVRVPMELTTLPWSVDQLTWAVPGHERHGWEAGHSVGHYDGGGPVRDRAAVRRPVARLSAGRGCGAPRCRRRRVRPPRPPRCRADDSCGTAAARVPVRPRARRCRARS